MGERSNIKIPTISAFYKPTVQALLDLGGSGRNDEINERVYSLMNLSDDVLETYHDESKKGLTEVDYRLSWARTHLKLAGIIENSSRGVWALLNPDIDIRVITPPFIARKKSNAINAMKSRHVIVAKDDNEIAEDGDLQSWKDILLDKLYTISPKAFEHLAQRMLRESGFTQVEVTGKTGDGGIDGKGILRLNGLLSFQVIFQCKRYRGTITPSQIRDFRGAMQGRADKGLFITTGSFTREAQREANRDGAPAIDLINGEDLCDKLKELNLGVKTETIESVSIDIEWFDKF